jgi:hypothetical protein
MDDDAVEIERAWRYRTATSLELCLPGPAVAALLRGLAVDVPDAAWLRDPAWEVPLTGTEREALLQHVKDVLVPALPDTVSYWDVDSSVAPEDAYDALKTEITTYREAFQHDPDTAAAFDGALEDTSQAIRSLEEDPERAYQAYPAESSATARAGPPVGCHKSRMPSDLGVRWPLVIAVRLRRCTRG